MTKINRVLIALFFLQILLVMGMNIGGQEPADTRLSKVFDGLDPAKVTRVKIIGEPKDAADPSAGPQQSIELVKDGTQWSLGGADNYPADNTKVDELLEKLAKLKSRGPVLTKASHHKKVEVADDKYQRDVTLTHDGKEIRFFVGTSPSFKNVHLRRAGSNEVLQASELTSWEVGTRAHDWINRDYVKFPEKDVWGVKVENKSGTIELAKSADGQWSLAGSSAPLKKSMIDDIVRKASTISVEEPIGKSEQAEHGLSDPLATVTLTTGTSTISGKMPDEMHTDVIKIGKKLDKENRYFAKASTSSYVVQVAGWAMEPLVTKSTKDLLEETKGDAAPKASDSTVKTSSPPKKK